MGPVAFGTHLKSMYIGLHLSRLIISCKMPESGKYSYNDSTRIHGPAHSTNHFQVKIEIFLLKLGSCCVVTVPIVWVIFLWLRFGCLMYTTQDIIMGLWRSLPRLLCICNFYRYVVIIWNRLPTEMRASVGLVTFSSWFSELVCGLLWSLYLNRCLFIGDAYPKLHTSWKLPIIRTHLKKISDCNLFTNLNQTPTFEWCIIFLQHQLLVRMGPRCWNFIMYLKNIRISKPLQFQFEWRWWLG